MPLGHFFFFFSMKVSPPPSTKFCMYPCQVQLNAHALSILDPVGTRTNLIFSYGAVYSQWRIQGFPWFPLKPPFTRIAKLAKIKFFPHQVNNSFLVPFFNSYVGGGLRLLDYAV